MKELTSFSNLFYEPQELLKYFYRKAPSMSAGALIGFTPKTVRTLDKTTALEGFFLFLKLYEILLNHKLFTPIKQLEPFFVWRLKKFNF